MKHSLRYPFPRALFLLLLALLATLPTLAQVPPGNALAFDGTDDYVALPNTTAVPTGNGTYTLEAWIKPNAMGVYGIIGWGNWGTNNQVNALRLSPTGLVNYWWGPDLIVTTPDLSGHWHHVAATFDGTTRTIYLDGVAVGSDTPGAHTVPSPSNLRIGCTNSPSSGANYEYFNGSIDEVRVWNVARTAAQVKAAYTSWPAAPQTGLVAAYGCNQGTAGGSNAGVATLTDQSGNASTGTLTNFALSGSTSNWVESYALVVPALAAATAVTTTGFTANWVAPVSGTVSGYVLDYATAPTFAPVAGSFSPAAGATSQVVSRLQANRNYYYRLRADKTSGTVTGQGGYASGTVRTPSGQTPPGNALAFDGSDDVVAVGSPAALSNLATGALTMESWAYCTNLTPTNSLIRKSGDYNLVLLAGGKPYAEVWPAGTSSSTRVTALALAPIEVNRWTHLAATWDGSALRLYVNGTLVPFVQNSSPISTSEQLQIGRSVAYNEPFAGRLDEVRIYNAALTAAQLQDDMASASAAVPASLLLYYNFDQGTASGANAGYTTLTDQSATLADGTLTNFDLSSGNTTSNWVESYALVVPKLAAATANAATSFTANWTAPALGAVSNYVLDVATSNSFTAASLVAGSPLTVAGTSTSQAVAGLSASQTYYYRVRADKAGSVSGQGAYSATGVRAPFTPMTPPGNALAFDGSDDYVTGNNNRLPQGNAARTLEAWVLTTASGNNVVVNYGTATSNLRSGILVVNGKAYYVGEGNDLQGAKAVNDGHWHHVAATYDGTTLKLYVDGVLDVSSTPTAFNTTGFDWNIGKRIPPLTLTEQFNGRLDEVRLYSAALTQAQVQADMKSTSAAVPASLVAYYNFDQGTAGGANAGYTTLTDQSATLADGTLTGFDLSSGNTTSNWVESYALVVPTLAAATANAATSFTANWTAPALGTVDNGYRLDVATSNAFTAASLVAGSPFTVAGTSQAVTGLNPAQTYYYRVRADKTSVTGQGASSATGVRQPATPMMPPGNALAFDGVDDYVSIPASPALDLTSGFTIEAWLKPAGGGTAAIQNVLCKSSASQNTGYLFPRTNNAWNSLTMWLNRGGGWQQYTVPYAANVGSWHHVAATYNGSTVLMYVDGVAVSPVVSGTIGSGPVATNTNPLTLGSQSGFNEYYFGALDETRVYSTVLTPAQIRADMTSTSPAVPGSLLLYYNFDQGTAGGANAGYTTLTDQSGNGNFGTLNNFNLGSGNTTSNWVESYALLQPTGLAASATTGTGFTASWAAPTINGAAPASGEVEGYVLDVSTSSTFASGVTSFVTTGYGSTSQVVTGLTNGTNYYLRVRAEKASVTGTGDYSATATTHTIGTDAFLTSLTSSAGTLSPAFASGTLAYTLPVPAGQPTFTLTPTASNSYTTLTANGAAVTSGTPTTSYPAGTLVTLVLTSEDGQATRTYTVQSVNTPDYYRSVASGNWGDVGTWEGSDDNATWSAVPYPPSAGLLPTVSIRSGHVVTVATYVQANRTTILSGGTLTVAPGTSLELLNGSASSSSNADLTVQSGGALTVPATAVLLVGRLSGTSGYTGSSATLGYLTVQSGGTFTVGGVALLNSGSGATTNLAAGTSTFSAGSRAILFATTTAPVIPVATWDSAATLELGGAVANTSVATSLNGKTLGSLDVNLTGSGLHVLLSGTGTATLAGNLTVTSTGTGTLRLLAQATTGGALTVNGSYVQNGGLVNGCAATSAVLISATTVAVSVAGSFTVNGGSFTANQGNGTNVTTIRPNPLTIGGDLTVGSGATFSLVSALLASNNVTSAAAVNYTTSRVNLLGNFTNNGTFTTGNTVATNTGQQLYFAKSGAQTFASAGTIGTATNRVNVTVNSGSTLDLGTSAFAGTGTFTTLAGSTLRLGSPAGISATGTATGNVQSTGTRTLSGNFELNGTAAQSTGTGFPATVATTIVVNNPAGVTLTQALAVTGTLSLRQGVVTTTAANLLTLGSSGSTLGTLDPVATNTGYVQGPLRRWVAAATATTAFPVGTAAVPRPAGIAYTTAPTAAGTLTAEFVASPAGSQGLPLTENGNTVTKGSDDGYWHFTAADGLVDGTYTATFTFAGITGVSDYSRLLLLKRPNATADWALLGTPVATTGTNTVPVLSRTDYTGFSDFTAGVGSAPLPVTLVSFTATAQGSAAVRLAWATASEVHSARYEVERSLDGTAFSKVGEVAAAGTTATAHAYAFTDAALPPAARLVYYRLRQVDLDGTAHYTPVRTVALAGAAAGLALYPNPTPGATTLTGVEAGAAVQVLDALGRLVATTTADASGTAALPGGLPAGAYVVRSGARAVRLTVE